MVYREKLRVLLVKDSTRREGYDHLLEREGKLNIVGEATSPAKAVELADTEVPDIVLIDSTMAPDLSLETIQCLKKAQPHIHIILISYETEEKYINEALKAGATGYIIKTNIGSELVAALLKVETGQLYLSPFIPKTIKKEHLPGRVGRRRIEMQDLTGRQKEILKSLSKGLTNKEIAQQFKLSVKTVDAHRANIMNKLKIHDLPGLVKYALRTGLTSLEE